MQAAETKLGPQGETLLSRYVKVRSHTEELCKPLEIEDYIPQPIIDVSPPKWNIAHTTWFFEEMILKRFVSEYRVFDEKFGFLFNSYYNSIGERTARDHRGDLSRPTVREVFAYREYVDEQMRTLLSVPPAVAGGDFGSVASSSALSSTTPSAAAAATPPIQEGNLRDLIILGLNHEQQHQELFLTDLKYTLSVNPLFPAYREDFAIEEISEPGSGGYAGVEGGIYEIGHAGDGFCFDNELSRHKVYLDDFEIAERIVTNLEYLMFVQDGGYTNHHLWHSEGWDWVTQNDIRSPLHWHQHDGVWCHFTLAGLRKLPMYSPVCHISYYEAAAFAEWREKRLPTEFEWEAASDKFDWGLRWEWTNSAYLPYPGYKKAAGAVGEYNGKFMINQMVLRGASVATPEGHSRSTYRNFFHPHLRWQFTGIRLAR
jgi:formylglycine-generating enzyme required for sulfatase activity